MRLLQTVFKRVWRWRIGNSLHERVIDIYILFMLSYSHADTAHLYSYMYVSSDIVCFVYTYIFCIRNVLYRIQHGR